MHLSSWGFFCCTALIALAPACRREEPPPAYSEDLGDEGEPLLPTSSAWKDSRIVDGTAEFHPFREPKAGNQPAEAAAPAEADAKQPDGDLQAELLGVVKEHNEALGGEDLAPVSDFYVEAQIETVKALVETLPALRDKLRELASALPEKQTDIESLAKLLSPEVVLKLDVSAVQPKGASEAAGTLATVPAVSFLSDAPAADQLPSEVVFRVGEDEFWYIESPIVAILGRNQGPLKEGLAALDSLIADAKAGTASAATLSERAPMLAQMLKRLPAAAETPEPDGEEKPAKPAAEEAPAPGSDEDGGEPGSADDAAPD